MGSIEPKEEDILDDSIRKSLVLGIFGIGVILVSMVSAHLLSRDRSSDKIVSYRILASKCISVNLEVSSLLAEDNLSNDDLNTIRRGIKGCKKRK